MPIIHANGIDQEYEWHSIEGSSQIPIALVAGMGGSRSYWKPQISDFAKNHPVLAYDQRGTGGSAAIKVESIEQLAIDFIGLLDALKLEKVHFVGHSTGGAIGQVIAIRYPERLASLVLYASVHKADHYRHRVWGLRKQILEAMGPEVYAKTTSLFFYPPEFTNAHHEELLAVEARTAQFELSSPEIMGSRIESILQFDVVADLGKIKTPTLVICSEDDLLTPAYFSQEMATLIPNAKLVLFQKGGHAYSRSNPEQFNQLVLDFIDQHAQ
jgi:aminoacrylate hydrolase